MNRNDRIWILESDRATIDLYKLIFDVRYETVYLNNLGELETKYKKLKKDEYPALLITSLTFSDGNLIEFYHKYEELFNFIPYYIICDLDDLEIMRFFYKHRALGYYLKPIKSNELIANIEWVITVDNMFKKIEINEYYPTVVFKELTVKEQQILNCFIKARDNICTREEISASIWQGLMVHEKTFDVHLCNLRSKLSKRGIKIQNLGMGKYFLENIGQLVKDPSN